MDCFDNFYSVDYVWRVRIPNGSFDSDDLGGVFEESNIIAMSGFTILEATPSSDSESDVIELCFMGEVLDGSQDFVFTFEMMAVQIF